MKTVQQKDAVLTKMGQEIDCSTSKTEEDSMQARCPYLSIHSKKICVRMVKAGLDGEVSDFDIEHFCNGSPIHCYYHRFSKSNSR